MLIIVDTNIVFSAILTPNGKISDLLLKKKPSYVQYFAPWAPLEELDFHHKKILKIAQYNLPQYQYVRDFVISKIQIVPEADINIINHSKAVEDLLTIDKDDAPFLALTYEKNGLLWTGDKKLIKGLSGNPGAKLTTDILYSQYF